MGSSCGLAQERLDLAPHHLDGIEIRRVGGQEPDIGPNLADQGDGLLVFVGCQIVHDHQITDPQGRHQHLLDIGPEDFGIGGPLDGHGGGGAIQAHRSRSPWWYASVHAGRQSAGAGPWDSACATWSCSF